MMVAKMHITLGCHPAAAQDRKVIGIINELGRSEMSVKTPRGLFTIFADEQTETMKDKKSRGLSILSVGDEVSVHCNEGSGKRMAIKIWAIVVTFAATIHYVNGDDIEVITSQNSDSQIGRASCRERV